MSFWRFLDPEASEESLKKPKKTPEKAQRTPKPTTQKPQIGNKNELLCAKFADFIERKFAQKTKQNLSKLFVFFLFVFIFLKV